VSRTGQTLMICGRRPRRAFILGDPVLDPETRTEYVILRADIYERIRALADETTADYPLAMSSA
jgi:hypothetical protein